MRRSGVCAFVLALASGASPLSAQPAPARVHTTAGVHTASFATASGTIRVHLPSDAAAGDAISGAILIEPAGASPQERDANVKALGSFVLEWQGDRTPVSRARYEWSIPASLRAGSSPLSLRDQTGALVAQASVPVDPVPAPALRPDASAGTFDVPVEGEIGKTAVIRGALGGRFADRTVSVGGTAADLLAVSPRTLTFRVPAVAPGLVPVRFASNQRSIVTSLRALDVRVVTSRSQLLRSQRATLTVTVFGLSGITEPATLTVVNQSPASVRIDDIERPITIAPRQVKRDGTFAVTRRLTALQPGAFVIAATVGRAPSAQFDVRASTGRTLTAWQARTGVAITGDASEGVQRSVLDARRRLDEFLRQQQASEGDVQDVFAALLSHYCFDLRDDGLSRRRAAIAPAAAGGIRLIAFRQTAPSGVEITGREVQRLPFSDFLSRLTERFRARQAVGYLFVRSTSPRSPIALDGEKRGQLTDRRFVTPVGVHRIVVEGPRTCQRTVTVNAFQTEVVQC